MTFTVADLVHRNILVNGSAATSFTGQQTGRQVTFRDGSEATEASFSVSVEDGNEDGSVPVARSFVFTVTSDPSSLTFASAGRGVAANLTTGVWSYADKVMAFGDSITHGDAPEGSDEHGYRGYLWLNLAGKNTLIDLVGPHSNGDVPDLNHAGDPGERADNLQSHLPGLLSTYSPDANRIG